MPKMIKLTDEVGNKLSEWAEKDSLTITGEIKKLMDERRERDALSCIEMRLDKIQSLIEDTTVDRLDKGAAKTSSSVTTYLGWADVREMMFDYATDEDWTSPAARQGMEESNASDEAKWYIDDGVWGEFYGDKQKYLKLTPHIIDFLKGKGYEL